MSDVRVHPYAVTQSQSKREKPERGGEREKEERETGS